MCSGISMYKEGLRFWKNLFGFTRYGGSFPDILLLPDYWGNRSLYRGLRYIEVCYIEVPL